MEDVRTTTRGTPCAQSWDDAWVAQVEAREHALERRICGARTIGGTPCPLPSDHASGRCRHHGGSALTGAPADNRNAVVHGLYSRRLLICGSHCPAWQSCPMGGGATFSFGPAFSLENEKEGPNEIDAGTTFIRHPDGSTEQRVNGATLFTPAPGTYDDNGDLIDTNEGDTLGGRASSRAEDRERAQARGDARPPKPAEPAPVSYAQALLKLPLAERPLCPYEQAEYNATVTDLMPRTAGPRANTFGLHLAHQIALLTVMVSRAARALAVAPLTETMEQTAEHYYMSLDKPSAALVAFEKLSRELRRWIALLEQHHAPAPVVPDPTAREHAHRQQHDTSPDPDSLAALDRIHAPAQSARAHSTPNTTLDEIDRAIVDSLFARFKIKPQGPTTEAQSNTEATKKTENPNNPATPSTVNPIKDDGG